MSTLDELHEGKIPCGKCGQWVGEREGIDHDPLYDAWICVGCQGAELATEALGVDVVAENLGFTTLDTGGGCTAFSKVLHDSTVLLLTGEDGSSIPEAGEENCILGHYADDSLEAYVTNYGSPHTFGTHYGDADDCFAEGYDRWIKSRQLQESE